MKCSNCGVEIPKEFTYAIQNNKCPSCGKAIMKQEQMAGYLSLVELIKTIVPKTKAEKIATLVIANFELKQLFKATETKSEEPQYSINPGDISSGGAGMTDDTTQYKAFVGSGGGGGAGSKATGLSDIEVAEAEAVMKETGIGFDTPDKHKAKALLQKMRDEALQGALDDRYGEDEAPISDNPIENAVANTIFQKQQDAQNKVLNGSADGKLGGFRRS